MVTHGITARLRDLEEKLLAFAKFNKLVLV